MAKLPDNPTTRLERYLARLAGQDVSIPDTPITRIECYLAYLIENGGGAAAPNAGAHNSMFRGKSLGSTFTEAQADAIDAGTFEDIFVGDYWEKSGRVYRVAGIDSFYRYGDTAFDKHHVVVMPDTPFNLSTARMNETATTEGGYAGCYARTTILPTAIFGENNILPHRTRLVDAVLNGKPNRSTWMDGLIELPTESMMIGRGAFGTHDANGLNVGEKLTQLPLFSLNPQFINNRGNAWLQDVVSATAFAYISNYGLAYSASANIALGMRPYVCIGKAS